MAKKNTFFFKFAFSLRRKTQRGDCNRGTAGFAYVGGACVVNKRLEKVTDTFIFYLSFDRCALFFFFFVLRLLNVVLWRPGEQRGHRRGHWRFLRHHRGCA